MLIFTYGNLRYIGNRKNKYKKAVIILSKEIIVLCKTIKKYINMKNII